ncbi:DUF1801 domain-containing protein [Gracilimonas tropica]|uniref:DUF1801 domain-containing protein n=1 Tax=Gracilimonas tropica TaxID=454600 RepID=UPI00047599AC|nr:DUF1801 domain-containing protein [Gracilimonas tropica]
MAELKTKKNDLNVDDYLNEIDDPGRKNDCITIHQIMKNITGKPGSMWGDSIVGYGSYHYKYASGREGDWMLTGFSNRKQSISLYIMSGFEKYQELLERLGKHKTGKSCLYINALNDIDVEVLKEMIGSSVQFMREKYETE